MKLTMNKILQGQEEVIIRYREMTPQIEAIKELVRGMDRRLIGDWQGERLLLLPEKVLYLESVDGASWAYLTDKVCRVSGGLGELTARYGDRGFFRCSKSMAINIYRIERLKSEPGNRIRATMENGEQVMISRKYAGQLRQILKGGAGDEEG